ncbi:HEPN domain-containing protein [Candidatus Acetothermia bacterium]|nr:HEPN domain-containing protein [Candidatus Acetothermia bacterium]MBI3459342.1 HEPN domain-containing protein [Candidatus Acetothermia bacterium]MBI3658863.1 HEPN domain-containing protein [Candidatus Acetothermia bacterium]
MSESLSHKILALAREHRQSAEVLYRERQFRDSISRSYYAIFHAARALVEAAGATSKKQEGVISHFDREFVKTGRLSKQLSKILHEAKDLREMSDYEESWQATGDKAQKLLDGATLFIQEVERFLST